MEYTPTNEDDCSRASPTNMGALVLDSLETSIGASTAQQEMFTESLELSDLMTSEPQPSKIQESQKPAASMLHSEVLSTGLSQQPLNRQMSLNLPSKVAATSTRRSGRSLSPLRHPQAKGQKPEPSEQPAMSTRTRRSDQSKLQQRSDQSVAVRPTEYREPQPLHTYQPQSPTQRSERSVSPKRHVQITGREPSELQANQSLPKQYTDMSTVRSDRSLSPVRPPQIKGQDTNGQETKGQKPSEHPVRQPPSTQPVTLARRSDQSKLQQRPYPTAAQKPTDRQYLHTKQRESSTLRSETSVSPKRPVHMDGQQPSEILAYQSLPGQRADVSTVRSDRSVSPARPKPTKGQQPAMSTMHSDELKLQQRTHSTVRQRPSDHLEPQSLLTHQPESSTLRSEKSVSPKRPLQSTGQKPLDLPAYQSLPMQDTEISMLSLDMSVFLSMPLQDGGEQPQEQLAPRSPPVQQPAMLRRSEHSTKPPRPRQTMVQQPQESLSPQTPTPPKRSGTLIASQPSESLAPPPAQSQQQASSQLRSERSGLPNLSKTAENQLTSINRQTVQSPSSQPSEAQTSELPASRIETAHGDIVFSKEVANYNISTGGGMKKSRGRDNAPAIDQQQNLHSSNNTITSWQSKQARKTRSSS